MAPSYTHIQNSTYGQWAIRVYRERGRERRERIYRMKNKKGYIRMEDKKGL
jgi:hypothetical protein